ncbi:MAG: hypothetical protein OER86_11175 [Phycisphaerae bacterium]|nr:hypothetical protein [Phycisphaerae bacterium]
MANITVQTEEDSGRGWRFGVELDDAGQTQQHTVTLSWAEYDLWSHGQVAPERVVEAAFQFLLEREPASAILASFDCAVIRRYFPEVDDALPAML